MKTCSRRRRRLRAEGLEARQLLAGDLAQVCAETPYLVGDANRDGMFDETDLIAVFQAAKYETGEPAAWSEGDFNDDGLFDSGDLVAAFKSGNYLAEPDEIRRQMWPDQIVLPPGFESEGIEMGNEHEFFLGGTSWSGDLSMAGAIYKGNLCSGMGEIIAPGTGKPLAGLSYDARTNYLYAASGDPGAFAGNFTNQGVNIYDASSGTLVEEIVFGDNMLMNDLLVTARAVYVTDSINPALYKIPLDESGNPNSLSWEKIDMNDFVMDSAGLGFNANGLVGDFDGDALVVVNINSGVLYKVEPATGDSVPINVQGEQELFIDGDGLYMNGRTLYVMQNFQNKIAVVLLSSDLTQGTFVQDIVSDDFAIPTTITGYDDSIYAINTHFCEITTFCGLEPDQVADPTQFQTNVVRVGA